MPQSSSIPLGLVNIFSRTIIATSFPTDAKIYKRCIWSSKIAKSSTLQIPPRVRRCCRSHAETSVARHRGHRRSSAPPAKHPSSSTAPHQLKTRRKNWDKKIHAIHTISCFSYCIVYLYDVSKDRVMTIHEVTTPDKSNEELTNGVDMVLPCFT